MAQGDLNTTSYLILGLLVSRDWSAYEIAEQVGRGVAEVWPRADRQRYNTPKRLVERGLITARTESVGEVRSRTVYSITQAGRDALTEWLATESRPPALEFEGVIRLMVAEQGSIEDLRANFETLRDHAARTRALFVQHAERLSEPDGGTFPERVHLMTLANKFMLDHTSNMIEWAEWALAETQTWPDTSSPATTHTERTREILADAIERYSDPDEH
ncbi:PadR family transcriptional regulator [Actinomycetes bacterium M1A6_2h]